MQSINKQPSQKIAGTVYANLYQSLHIGCKNYSGISEEFGTVSESYNDVEKYMKFFLNDLKFKKKFVNSITDDNINLSEDFKNKIT